MKPKIIVLTIAPYSTEILPNYYHQREFLRENYDLEEWSLCDYFLYNQDKKMYASHVSYFKSPQDVEVAVETLRTSFICFLQIPFRRETYSLIRFLHARALKCLVVDHVSGLLSFCSQKSPFTMRKRSIRPSNFFKVLREKIAYERFKKSGIKNEILYFRAAKEAAETKFSLNHHDYDRYKNVAAVIPSSQYEKHIVFVDIALPDHPDLGMYGVKRRDRESYLRKLSDFFEKLEAEFETPVIIAAHPRSNYKTSDFNNRKILKNQTAELVSTSLFSIYHTSNAISYSVLSMKPMLFIYDTEFDNHQSLHSILQTIRCTANYFRSPLLNIDTLTNLNEVKLNVDKAAYEQFKQSYLESLSPDTDNYDKLKLVIDQIIKNEK